jgi:hypothetical protein
VWLGWTASGMIPKERQLHVPHWRHNRAVRDMFPPRSSSTVRSTYTRDSLFHSSSDVQPTRPKQPAYELNLTQTTVQL